MGKRAVQFILILALAGTAAWLFKNKGSFSGPPAKLVVTQRTEPDTFKRQMCIRDSPLGAPKSGIWPN